MLEKYATGSRLQVILALYQTNTAKNIYLKCSLFEPSFFQFSIKGLFCMYLD